MTLYEKMNAIMSDVQFLQKDDNVAFGQTKYKALSEEKVTSIMREQLVKHRLLVYPIEQTASREGNITHVDVKYRLQDVDDPESYIDIASCGDGADTQDKGAGKAMTYAFKYMWLRTFALPTGEDPDKISSEELDYKQSLTGYITEREFRNLTDLCKRHDKDLAWLLSTASAASGREITKEGYAKVVKALDN